MGNEATSGAGMACVGGTTNPLTIYNVTFTEDQSYSLTLSEADVYSDGSCTDPFWYSATVCPELTCSSCSVSISHI